ncbi:unnamed protein product [Ceutorhynchus assimilis]|uniref:Uncharacterized protein n=1 Tax=Ceutorhynchus assimilis TaxID=467358 RepID=A0A9N9MZR3_9CUCU|nr:unnamed protein product [Ceutorhynchus assimilis]
MRSDVRNFDLSQLLNETITGKALVAIYKKYGDFDPKYQGYLCDLIVQHFLNQSNFQKLTNEDLSGIADSIIETFPKEVKTNYFIEPVKEKFSKENKSGFARGKLTDKYRNRLIFLRKSGLLTCVRDKSITPVPENLDLSAEGDSKDDLVWLQHRNEPWSTVEEKWKILLSIEESCCRA